MEEGGEGKEERGKGGGTEGEKADKDRGKRGEGRRKRREGRTHIQQCVPNTHTHTLQCLNTLCAVIKFILQTKQTT